MRKNFWAIALVFAWTVVLAAWPVNAAYDGSAEASNVRNIQAMGYHAVTRPGKVYKFEFSDGTVAYYLRLPGLTVYKFQQVSEAEYEESPGEEYDPNQPVPNSGGSGSGGDSGENLAMDNLQDYLNQFPPGSVIYIGEAPEGTVTCEPACF